MRNDSVKAYWIEADTLELASQNMGSADIFRGGTYESEVLSKYARDPLEIVIIPMSQHGSDWAKSEVQRLKDKSATLQKRVVGDP